MYSKGYDWSLHHPTLSVVIHNDNMSCDIEHYPNVAIISLVLIEYKLIDLRSRSNISSDHDFTTFKFISSSNYWNYGSISGNQC
jgi:hypothetical protein